jgi:hypothetical protein
LLATLYYVFVFVWKIIKQAKKKEEGKNKKEMDGKT